MGKFVLPDQAIEILHALADNDSASQFGVGDICRDLVDEFGGVVPRYEIRRAVALEYGAAPSTVRDREYVCRLVSANMRDSFPLLGYHHWRSITSCKDKTKLEELATWATEQGDSHGGRVASVLAIRRHLKDGGNDEPGWLRRWNKVLDMLSELEQDETAPNPIRSFSYRIREKAKHLAY